MKEWRLDVPTIGTVYQWPAKVMTYLSGLGRPLTLKDGDLDSGRCWFRRAWTLQEVGETSVIVGDTPDGPLHAKHKDGEYETELLTRFHKQLQSMEDMLYRVLGALEEMQKRVSTNPVDKIAGLAFVMASKTIPAYYESQSLEGAWTALVNLMDRRLRGELLFLGPEPGNAGTKWRLSWDQVMMRPLPTYDHDPGVFVDWDEGRDEDSCDVYCIEQGLVQGLAVVEGPRDRHGELIVKDKHGIEHGFKITATHMYPIPEDTYTLIDSYSEGERLCYGWVVGKSLPGGKFAKVSVLEISLEEKNRLDRLCITEKRQYILI